MPPKSRRARRRRALVALLAATAALVAVLPIPSRPHDPASQLAAALRRAYEPSVAPGARWRRRAVVTMPDGREVPREEAYRDAPAFVPAAGLLVASRRGDDAPLGAWLLGTAPRAARAEAEAALLTALGHRRGAVAFEAALALGRLGEPSGAARDALAGISRRSAVPEVRAAAASALGRSPAEGPGLAVGFRRGVSWWMSETGPDEGAASFRRLAGLGVTWVSFHTWDPLQRGLADPVLASPPAGRPFGFRDLPALVRSAHRAGLRVMVKPHLEMRGYEPSEAERRIGHFAPREHLDHNRIAMRSEADWQRWFEGYERYVLRYAREAQAAGADALCVGRELDSTVRLREADWRRVIARVRREFEGPLTYSANFDSWHDLAFWDALDFIGVSAYFPLSTAEAPSLAELEAGWDRALAPLEEAHRRWRRPVLLTEAGFPSIPSAARAPWREERRPADAWLQARCYEATLRALARRPWIEGSFFWLWERTARPAFRDPSHAIVDKPASFTMARWYAARSSAR